MQRETLVNGDMSHPSSSNSSTHHPNNYPMLLAAQQQLYDYALRLRFAAAASAGAGTPNTPTTLPALPAPPSANNTVLAPHPSYADPHSLFAYHQRNDPRLRCLMREEPKPSYSYIGLIAMAILSSPERKLVLSDIYQWILDHYAYFRARGPGWRNSIRHNLSLNDCFIKAGRSANGKGHYWSIHPANLADFSSGDFRRRRAQRRVRKSMGLSVPDDDDDDDDILPAASNHFDASLSKFPPSEELRANGTDLSHSSSSSSSTTAPGTATTTTPTPTPTTTTTNSHHGTPNLLQRYFDDIQRAVATRIDHQSTPNQLFFPSPPSSLNTSRTTSTSNSSSSSTSSSTVTSTPLRPLTSIQNPRKRCFDVDSLLAPEQPCLIKRKKGSFDAHEDHLGSPDSKSDGSTDTDISA